MQYLRLPYVVWLLWAISSTCQAQSLNLSDVQAAESKFGRIDIIKLWDERFSELSRYQVFFASESEAPRQSLIQIWRGGSELRIHDWSSADCAIQKVQLRKENGEIYLLVATRQSVSESILPQSAPAIQQIEIFKLIDNKEFNEKGLVGRGRQYFNALSSTSTAEKLCSTEEVNKALGNVSIASN